MIRTHAAWHGSLSRAGLILAALAAAPTLAAAQSITATQTYSLGSGPPITVSDGPSATSADVAPSATDGSNDSVFGHTYGAAGGALGSRSSGAGIFGITGTADFTSVFTNTTGVPVDLQVSFVIDAGQLQVTLPSPSSGVESASLSALLTSNGNTLFDYESSMTAFDPTLTPAFDESGLVLNAAGATLSPGDGSYGWTATTDVADAGILLPGQSDTIEYTLTSAASGTAAATPCLVLAASIGSGGCGNPNAIGRIGDPVSAAGPALSFAALPVSEPPSALLLLVALTGLAVRRHAAASRHAQKFVSRTLS